MPQPEREFVVPARLRRQHLADEPELSGGQPPVELAGMPAPARDEEQLRIRRGRENGPRRIPGEKLARLKAAVDHELGVRPGGGHADKHKPQQDLTTVGNDWHRGPRMYEFGRRESERDTTIPHGLILGKRFPVAMARRAAGPHAICTPTMNDSGCAYLASYLRPIPSVR